MGSSVQTVRVSLGLWSKTLTTKTKTKSCQTMNMIGCLRPPKLL